jgi:hypothetical protein
MKITKKEFLQLMDHVAQATGYYKLLPSVLVETHHMNIVSTYSQVATAAFQTFLTDDTFVKDDKMIEALAAMKDYGCTLSDTGEVAFA